MTDRRRRVRFGSLFLYGVYVVAALFIKDPRTKFALIGGSLIPLAVMWGAEWIGRLAEHVVGLPHGEENLGRLLFMLGCAALVLHGVIIFWKLLQ